MALLAFIVAISVPLADCLMHRASIPVKSCTAIQAGIRGGKFRKVKITYEKLFALIFAKTRRQPSPDRIDQLTCWVVVGSSRGKCRAFEVRPGTEHDIRSSGKDVMLALAEHSWRGPVLLCLSFRRLRPIKCCFGRASPAPPCRHWRHAVLQRPLQQSHPLLSVL